MFKKINKVDVTMIKIQRKKGERKKEGKGYLVSNFPIYKHLGPLEARQQVFIFAMPLVIY